LEQKLWESGRLGRNGKTFFGRPPRVHAFDRNPFGAKDIMASGACASRIEGRTGR